MPDVVIENPIINSPFREPTRHFVFGDQGITSEIADGRRKSSYFIPIAQSRRGGASRGRDPMTIVEQVEAAIREVELARRGDKTLQSLREFRDRMREAGLLVAKPYDLPLVDTIGRTAHSSESRSAQAPE